MSAPGKDRPILFSGPMVRALLDGRKTMTRRVLKPQPSTRTRFVGIYAPHLTAVFEPERPGADEAIRIPYSLRDRLWVRESITRFDKGTCDQHVWYRAGRNDPSYSDTRFLGSTEGEWTLPDGPGGGAPYNVPSIHMPRWASRLTLIVTDVRVERVQEISEEDARAEGCFIDRTSMRLGGDEWSSARDWFADLWDSLNASRGLGWDANPWVAALTFTVHHRNIDALREADGVALPTGRPYSSHFND